MCVIIERLFNDLFRNISRCCCVQLDLCDSDMRADNGTIALGGVDA